MEQSNPNSDSTESPKIKPKRKNSASKILNKNASESKTDSSKKAKPRALKELEISPANYLSTQGKFLPYGSDGHDCDFKWYRQKMSPKKRQQLLLSYYDIFNSYHSK